MSRLKNVIANLKSLAIHPSKFRGFNDDYDGFIDQSNVLSVLGGEIAAHDGYISNTDAYSVISKIARNAASIPILIKNTLPDGTKEIITEGDFFEFINKPNDHQNINEFTEDGVGFQLISGNEFIAGRKPEAFPHVSKVVILSSHDTDIKSKTITPFDIELKYTTTLSGKSFQFNSEEVRHVKYFNPSKSGHEKWRGLSPLEAGYKTLSTSNDQMTAQSSAFKNRGASGLLSSEGDRPMTADEGKDLQEAVNKKLGGANKFNQVSATSAKVKYLQLGLSPGDLKLIESNTMTLRQFCNMYCTNSSLFNDPANKIYNNQKEAIKEHYNGAVLPALNRHLVAFSDLVIPGWNARDNKNYSLEPDLSSIEALQDDQNKRAEKQTKLVNGISNLLDKVGRGVVDSESAISTLIYSYDMDREEAEDIVGNTGNNSNDE